MLWIGNSIIATWLYPEYTTDAIAWDSHDAFRKKIYEVMFLIFIGSQFLKPSRLSDSLSVVGLLWIGASVIDKLFQGVISYQLRDFTVVIPIGIALGVIVYRYHSVINHIFYGEKK